MYVTITVYILSWNIIYSKNMNSCTVYVLWIVPLNTNACTNEPLTPQF